jgi:hypothetical protein
MVLLGQDMEIVAFMPKELQQFPTFSPSGTTDVRRFRLFGQLPGRNKLKGPGSRLLVSRFPEIKFILSCCRVL